MASQAINPDAAATWVVASALAAIPSAAGFNATVKVPSSTSLEPEPPEGAWDAAIQGYREDLESLQELAQDRSIDLFATIPHGSGQTYLREFLLVADHAAYHVGQIVLVRRLLNNWTV